MTAETAPRLSASTAVDAFARRHRLQWGEALLGSIAILAYFVFPDYLALGAQVLATVLFGLSLDLILGYAGIVTLGHAAFFGTGAYAAGLLAAHGWGEPLSGLVVAALAAAAVGFASGAVVLRTRGFTLLMLTLVVATMLYEAANKATPITGGADGLGGWMSGRSWASLRSLRQDRLLVLPWHAVPVLARRPRDRALAVRPLAHRHPRERAAHARDRLAGLLAPPHHLYDLGGDGGRRRRAHRADDRVRGLGVLSFDRSGAILIMLILGGVGRLYGAFIGVPLYMILQDRSPRSIRSIGISGSASCWCWS